MDEKTMVNDVLSNVKASLTAYQTAISESENTGLRQTFQTIRNNDESFQYELFKVAETAVKFVVRSKLSRLISKTEATKIRI